MNWYLKVLKQYADFSGRARRKEYWMFTLFDLIFVVTLSILDRVFGWVIWEGASIINSYGVLFILYTLAVFLPRLAVSVRRLHDIDKSGWTLLLHLIPIVGSIWIFVYHVIDSDPGDNEYGTNPKA